MQNWFATIQKQLKGIKIIGNVLNQNKTFNEKVTATSITITSITIT